VSELKPADSATSSGAIQQKSSFTSRPPWIGRFFVATRCAAFGSCWSTQRRKRRFALGDAVHNRGFRIYARAGR